MKMLPLNLPLDSLAKIKSLLRSSKAEWYPLTKELCAAQQKGLVISYNAEVHTLSTSFMLFESYGICYKVYIDSKYKKNFEKFVQYIKTKYQADKITCEMNGNISVFEFHICIDEWLTNVINDI